MRRLMAVVVVLFPAACTPGEAILTVQPSDVSSHIEVEMIGTPENTLDVSIGDLEQGDTTWALQRLELQGIARNWRTTVELPATSFVLDDTSITPADSNARSIDLSRNDRLEIIIRVGPDRPLRPGLHLVEFEIPVTVARLSSPVGNPYSARLAISMRHRVMDPVRREQTQTFCDEAVPLVEFRIPTSSELNIVIESAGRNLTQAQASEVGRDARQLADEADAFYASVSTSLSTDRLVGVIAEICRIQLKAMGVTGGP